MEALKSARPNRTIIHRGCNEYEIIDGAHHVIRSISQDALAQRPDLAVEALDTAMDIFIAAQSGITNGKIYIGEDGARRRVHGIDSGSIWVREWKCGIMQPHIDGGWGWGSVYRIPLESRKRLGTRES